MNLHEPNDRKQKFIVNFFFLLILNNFGSKTWAASLRHFRSGWFSLHQLIIYLCKGCYLFECVYLFGDYLARLCAKLSTGPIKCWCVSQWRQGDPDFNLSAASGIHSAKHHLFLLLTLSETGVLQKEEKTSQSRRWSRSVKLNRKPTKWAGRHSTIRS